MKLKELIPADGIVEMNADPEQEITGISYDSRRTEPGDLFVAIRGFETDGHRYIAKAAEMGAAAVLCEEKPEQDIPYVRVCDSRLALALASCAFFGHPAEQMRMIGVTGTSGKTSVTTLLKGVLEKTRGAKVGLIGTIGIQIGEEFLPSEHTTPESYELQRLFRHMADEGCSHVVMEVSSHALELQRVAGFRFHTAVYTNLSQDQFMIQDHACPVIGFGLNEEAALRAENPRLLPDRVCFDTVYEGRRIPSELKIPGTFSVSNALAVTSAALSEGIAPEESLGALRSAHGVKGRLESVPTDGNYHVLIDYSHKPDALEKVLKSLRPVTRGRLICVFGCGGDRDRLKRPLMGAISGRNADLTILTSDNPRTEDPEAIIDEIEAGIRDIGSEYIRICDRIEAIHRAIDLARDGDVILLAGKGHENYQIIGHTKRHMDEVEIVRDYMIDRKARGET